MDLYLPTQLVDHFAVNQLLLSEDLQGNDVLAAAFPCQVDVAVPR